MLDIPQKYVLFYNERLMTSLTQKASMNVNTYLLHKVCKMANSGSL